jgi:hypothetical protein
VAEAIAGALESYGPVHLVAAEEASATVWDQCDLLLVGGPTEGRHMTPPVGAFFDRLPTRALRGIDAAAFDTRLDWPALLSGSAAGQIRRRLLDAGASVVVAPESFKVCSRPELRYGELERAPIWARKVAAACRAGAAQPAVAHPALA